MGRLSENSVLNIKNRSHAVTAEVVVPEAGAEGGILAPGGAVAGWGPSGDAGPPGVGPRPGRRVRRREPVREGRAPDLLLQPARPAALQDRGRLRDPAGH